MKKLSLVIFLLFGCAQDVARDEAFDWLDRYYGKERNSYAVSCSSDGICIATNLTGRSVVLSCAISKCGTRNGCLLITDSPNR